MRLLFLILSVFFCIISIAFTILPMDTLVLLPIGLCLLFCFLCLWKSTNNQVKFPKFIILIAGIALLSSFGKMLFIKDEIVVDQKFEQQKIETKIEAKKELEEIEDLE